MLEQICSTTVPFDVMVKVLRVTLSGKQNCGPTGFNFICCAPAQNHLLEEIFYVELIQHWFSYIVH